LKNKTRILYNFEAMNAKIILKIQYTIKLSMKANKYIQNLLAYVSKINA
jgi:hypothetical protein